jgi:transposase
MKINRQNQSTRNNTQTQPKSVKPSVAPSGSTRARADGVQARGRAPRSVEPMSAAQFLEELQRQQEQKGVLARDDAQTDAVVEEIVATAQKAVPTQPTAAVRPTERAPGHRAHAVIKLGIDVHADRFVVVRQIDGGAPQPAQRFSPSQFIEWAQKQLTLAERVYSCYEAGPFGYGLHRKLTGLGVTNYVVRPRDWDEYGKKVKTDKRDAKALVLCLDRYVNGNRDAFCVVRVPTETEEQARSRSRQRQSLQNEMQRLAAQGRSDALYYGARLEGQWWVEAKWKELALAPIVMELLEPLRRVILAMEQELKAQTKAIVQAAPEQLPVGLGKLTYEVLEREICDWGRFKNRRQVASYTGMCPREDTSDQRRFQGSINKHGNPRVRSVLVEASWRLIQFQPTYKPVAKWRPLLLNPKTTRSKRKQIAVAIGRQFSVDWWRVRTQRCQAQDLGLQLNPAPVQLPPTPRAKTKSATATQKAA